MRKSPLGYTGPMLIVAAICLFAFLFYQKGLLIAIQYMLLTSDKSVGMERPVTGGPEVGSPADLSEVSNIYWIAINSPF